MFPVLEQIAFEPGAGISLIYDENICNRQSTCYQTVLRFQIWLREMFPNLIFPRLMENGIKVLQWRFQQCLGHEGISKGVVRQDSPALKKPHFSGSITSEIFKLWRSSFFWKCAKVYVDCKNLLKFSENAFEITAFELVVGISLFYDKNTCDRQSMCYQTVLRFWI